MHMDGGLPLEVALLQEVLSAHFEDFFFHLRCLTFLALFTFLGILTLGTLLLFACKCFFIIVVLLSVKLNWKGFANCISFLTVSNAHVKRADVGF